jgi:hypothetical protein
MTAKPWHLCHNHLCHTDRMHVCHTLVPGGSACDGDPTPFRNRDALHAQLLRMTDTSGATSIQRRVEMAAAAAVRESGIAIDRGQATEFYSARMRRLLDARIPNEGLDAEDVKQQVNEALLAAEADGLIDLSDGLPEIAFHMLWAGAGPANGDQIEIGPGVQPADGGKVLIGHASDGVAKREAAAAKRELTGDQLDQLQTLSDQIGSAYENAIVKQRQWAQGDLPAAIERLADFVFDAKHAFVQMEPPAVPATGVPDVGPVIGPEHPPTCPANDAAVNAAASGLLEELRENESDGVPMPEKPGAPVDVEFDPAWVDDEIRRLTKCAVDVMKTAIAFSATEQRFDECRELLRVLDDLRRVGPIPSSRPTCRWSGCDQEGRLCDGHAHELVDPLGLLKAMTEDERQVILDRMARAPIP